jgi:hypothetical protein
MSGVESVGADRGGDGGTASAGSGINVDSDGAERGGGGGSEDSDGADRGGGDGSEDSDGVDRGGGDGSAINADSGNRDNNIDDSAQNSAATVSTQDDDDSYLPGTVRVFRQGFALEDVIGSLTRSLEARMRVTNDILSGVVTEFMVGAVVGLKPACV